MLSRMEAGSHRNPDVVSALLAEGLSVRAVAERLGVSFSTVRYWMGRHGLQSAYSRRVDLVRKAADAGLKETTLECPTHGLTEFRILLGPRARCKRCISDAVTARRRFVKDVLVREAGGRCAICGYDRHPAALQFHHVDRATKTFGISRAGVTRTLDAARAEARKCILLCSNCHAEVEVGARHLPVQLGPLPTGATDPG
jgi:transcriptional regulator with XRE-family HTH domain